MIGCVSPVSSPFLSFNDKKGTCITKKESRTMITGKFNPMITRGKQNVITKSFYLLSKKNVKITKNNVKITKTKN